QKIQHTSSVRRPESGTWHGRVWRWRQQQWEAVQWTHERLWTWQQHEEAVYRAYGRLGGLAAAMGAHNLPAPYVKKFYTPACVEET
ncbi:unnamed protein product, partial [Staurois parvus]